MNLIAKKLIYPQPIRRHYHPKYLQITLPLSVIIIALGPNSRASFLYDKFSRGKFYLLVCTRLYGQQRKLVKVNEPNSTVHCSVYMLMSPIVHCDVLYTLCKHHNGKQQRLTLSKKNVS